MVALRKESVDRNIALGGQVYQFRMVALRKESVDRNCCCLCCCGFRLGSLSARRAWIEIFDGLAAVQLFQVALRKESVDRNAVSVYTALDRQAVALRKESVDRNKRLGLLGWLRVLGRSPQGERG